MRDFVDTLPLRLAAVVAALVGAVCLWNGVDLWVSAGRVGVAFFLLLLAGLVVRRLILSFHEESGPGSDSPPALDTRGTPSEDTSPERGKNVDVITPGTPVGELLRDDEREAQ